MTEEQQTLHSGADRLPCPLRKAAEEAPEALALIGPRAQLRYGELDRRVASVAAALEARGLEEGTRVALYRPRDIDYVVLLLALWRLGAVAAPLSTRTPAGALAPLLEALGSRHLIASRDAAAEPPPGTTVYDDSVLLAGAGVDPSAAAAWPLDRAATAVFTSGSTGRPKAALHTLGNHYYSARGSNQNLPLGPGDRWLLSLPLYHVGGLAIVFRCLLARAAVVVPEASRSLAEAVRRYDVSHLSLVATQLRRLLTQNAAAQAPSDGLRAALVGGSAVPTPLIEAAHAAGWPLFTTYGMTEMASQVTTTRPNASLEELKTSGALLPYRELRLAEDGEILVKGKTRFAGYLQDGTLVQPFDAQGWFATGDRGWLGPDGLLHVVGRKDNLLISGGENIQPEEIERVLERLGGVERAVVVPVADTEFGERPVAFVRRQHGGTPALEELPERLAGHLPRFKIPDAFYVWPADYATAGMKIDRAYFRERARQLREKNIEQTPR